VGIPCSIPTDIVCSPIEEFDLGNCKRQDISWSALSLSLSLSLCLEYN
jgi:hypothetical protein